jgi:hypothetical protein
MKKLKFLFSIAFTFSIITCFSQFRSNNIAGYTFSIQVDSSHYYILGGQPNKADKNKYVSEEKGQGYTSYSGEVTLWTNAFIFNDSTGKLTKVFDLPLIAVYPALNVMQFLKYDYFYQKAATSGATKENLVFAVKTDAYNNDAVIDSDDPVYLYVSKKDGTGVKQITPNGMHVTNWKLINGGMGILATLQPDKNMDKKFTEEEELYHIELDADISKIKIKMIPVSK